MHQTNVAAVRPPQLLGHSWIGDYGVGQEIMPTQCRKDRPRQAKIAIVPRLSKRGGSVELDENQKTHRRLPIKM